MSTIPAPRPARTAWFLLAAALIYAANVGLSRWVGATAPVPEWAVGFDLLLLVPALYLWLMRPARRQALLGVAAALSMGILVGAFIIPAADKQLWPWLERLRWVGLGALVLVQAVLIARVAADLWRSRHAAHTEAALHGAISRFLGDGVSARVVQADARLWLYLLRRRPRLAWPEPAFYSARHGGNASNQLGFLWLVAAEIPIVHGLLHVLAGPAWALGVTAASLYGLAFLYAEYRATLLRATTLEADALCLRQGLLIDIAVPYSAIAEVRAADARPPRKAKQLRVLGGGRANLLLRLHPGTRLQALAGAREVEAVYLGVDTPAALMAALGERCGING